MATQQQRQTKRKRSSSSKKSTLPVPLEKLIKLKRFVRANHEKTDDEILAWGHQNDVFEAEGRTQKNEEALGIARESARKFFENEPEECTKERSSCWCANCTWQDEENDLAECRFFSMVHAKCECNIKACQKEERRRKRQIRKEQKEEEARFRKWQEDHRMYEEREKREREARGREREKERQAQQSEAQRSGEA